MATLFPITWREPFGLVMIESMAVGTPVIAIALGAAPEIMQHGKTGFLCHSVADCLAALAEVSQISRGDCRTHVIENFSVQRMTDGYEAVYRQVVADRFAQNGRPATLVRR